MQNIFVKKNPKNNTNNSLLKILPKNKIMSSIPENAKTEEDIDLAKTHLEIRWRIFKFPNIDNEIIEMSQKLLNNNRLYMNKKGDWVNYNDDDKYNQYIIKKFYHYQKTNE